MSDVLPGNGGGRKRYRRGGRASGLQPMVRKMGFIPRLWRKLESITNSRFLSALPLFSYMFLGSVYFLALLQSVTDVNSFTMYWVAGVQDDPAEKLAAELLKQKIQILSYLLTFFLLVFRLREFFSFFTRERTLLLLVLAVLFSALGSDYPERVIVNLVHLVFGIIATWLYFNDKQRQQRLVYSACVITLWPILLTLTGSVLLFVFHESSSIVAIVEGNRFSGISGNPNTLGGVCIAGAWATFGLMVHTPLKSRFMFLLVVSLSVILFNAWTTGSATTLSIIIFMALLMVGFRAYELLGRKVRAGIILGGTILFFAVLFVFVVQQNADDYALAATEAVGKDLTLTGRTDLWLIGWEAFVERPIFGWGYDNHQTVMETPLYGVPYNHYHNGYLDSLVSGGVLFGAAILISYGSFVRRYSVFRKSVAGTLGFPLLVAIAAVSIQNLTEYSLFRSNTALWQIYFISFIAVAMKFILLVS